MSGLNIFSRQQVTERVSISIIKKGEIYPIILSSVLGSLISYLAVSLVLPDYNTFIPLIVGCLTGAMGGFQAGNIGESIAFIMNMEDNHSIRLN